MITVHIKKDKSITSFQTDLNCEVSRLRDHASKNLKIPLDRVRVQIRNPKTKQLLAVSDEKTIAEYKDHIIDQTLTVQCEDEADTTGFVIGAFFAYIFPIITYVVFMAYNPEKVNSYHVLVTLLIIFHYGKRELENKFVHIYTKSSEQRWPPAGVLVHYWMICGIAIPYEIYILRNMTLYYSAVTTMALICLFLLFEFLNFYCHYQLRLLRFETVNNHTRMVRSRKVPRGLFFDQMIAPNYTFETCAWIVFAIFSRSFFSVVFAFSSTAAMYLQAKKRKEALLNSTSLSAQDKRDIAKKGVYLPF